MSYSAEGGVVTSTTKRLKEVHVLSVPKMGTGGTASTHNTGSKGDIMIKAKIQIEQDNEDWSSDLFKFVEIQAIPPVDGFMFVDLSEMEKKAQSDLEIGRYFFNYLYGNDDELPDEEKVKKICFDEAHIVKSLIYTEGNDPIGILLGRD